MVGFYQLDLINIRKYKYDMAGLLIHKNYLAHNYQRIIKLFNYSELLLQKNSHLWLPSNLSERRRYKYQIHKQATDDQCPSISPLVKKKKPTSPTLPLTPFEKRNKKYKNIRKYKNIKIKIKCKARAHFVSLICRHK